MRKKIIAIMAAVLAILIIIAVVLGMKGKDKATDDKSGNDVEIEAEAGLEESIFDDEDTEAADSENDKVSEEANSSGSKGGTPENPEEVILGDKPVGNTGNQQSSSGNKSNKTNKTNKPSNSDKGDKNDKNDKNDKDTSSKNPSVQEDGKMKYEEFHAMAPSKQQAYMESFDDIDEFFEWYNAAKAKYEKENPSIEVDGGAIDLDKIANED